jgi:hypothetical protein
MSGALDAALERAHAAGDAPSLAALYARAAEISPGPDAAAFFLTQAYVWALDAGEPAAADLHARLKAAGREE